MSKPLFEINNCLLTCIARASIRTDSNSRTLLQLLNISESVASKIATLDLTVRDDVADTQLPLFDVQLDVENLNRRIEQMLSRAEHSLLLDKAILLGASRQIMSELADIAQIEFRNRRIRLGVLNDRRRPAELSTEERQQIDNVLLQFDSKKITRRIDKLRRLVEVADRTDIAINRIYKYYERIF